MIQIEIDPQEVFKVTLETGQVLLFEEQDNMMSMLNRELLNMMRNTKEKLHRASWSRENE